jgi:hypothetical protein
MEDVLLQSNETTLCATADIRLDRFTEALSHFARAANEYAAAQLSSNMNSRRSS